MATGSLHEIKQQLAHLPKEEIIRICLRLGRFKKDNKELIHFMLFDANDVPAYIQSAKEEMEAGFNNLPLSNMYFTKKKLRKVLTEAGKKIKYTASKEATIELLIHFCNLMNENRVPYKRYPVLKNMYNQQLKKIRTAIETLHEDLQYDYEKMMEDL